MPSSMVAGLSVAKRGMSALVLAACAYGGHVAGGAAQEPPEQWQQTFTIRAVASDCKTVATRTAEVCAPAGWVIRRSIRNVRSNGGRGDVKLEPDPVANATCVKVIATARPRPEDLKCIQVLLSRNCECRNPAWVEADITLFAAHRPGQ
jgi:hypothetical protein